MQQIASSWQAHGIQLGFSERLTYLARLRSMRSANQIQTLLCDEASGITASDISGNGNDGRYAAAGITYNDVNINGVAVPTFDGSNTFVDMVDRTGNNFPTDWDGNSYSAIIWGLVDGAVRWIGDSTFRYLWHVRDGSDATYYTVMGKHTTDHKLFWRRRTGGVITELSYTFSPTGTVQPFCMGITHLQSAPYLRAYLYADGVWQEAAESTSANLTDWGDHPPTGGTSLLFAGSITLQEWIGSGGIGVTWDVPLTADEMRQVMVP